MAAMLLLCAAAAGRDGPTQRPAWLGRVTGEPLRGCEVAPEDWRVSGGGIDGGPRTPGGFPARGVTLLAWLPLNALPGDSEAGAECWGYTSPSGREYAIMCVHNGTSFLEVTDPLEPRAIGFIGGASSLWHDPTPWKPGPRPSKLGARFSSEAAVVGEYCYAASDVEGGSGLQIIDLRRIDEGVVVHVKNWSAGGLMSVQALAADEKGRRILACGSNIGNGGVVVLDVADPESPVLAGAWTERPVQSAFAFVPGGGSLAGRHLAACFLGTASKSAEDGFAILDVTDLDAIRVLSQFASPGGGSCRQGWSTPDQRYLYCGEHLSRPAGRAFTGIPASTTRALDINDPATPKSLGTFATPRSGAIIRSQVVAGRTLYQADGTAGLRVFDVSDPTSPVEFASFDTYPENDGARDQGAWGVYPFFRSGTILVSDMQRGLFVLRVHRRGDLDGDGKLTSLDLGMFTDQFLTDDAAADVNGDGALDECDYLDFYGLFHPPDGIFRNSP